MEKTSENLKVKEKLLKKFSMIIINIIEKEYQDSIYQTLIIIDFLLFLYSK